jgi:signal transduction histidine kinase
MKNKIALKITLIYFLIGFLWILFSDQFILSISGSGNSITVLQTYKGWFFVGTTAIILFFLIRNEIRKKNRIEESLMKAKLKAEESDILKSAFLSNLSHEVRTPLNGILGFCELMLDESFGSDDKITFAKNLTKNGNELLKLMNDIMDISRIQENQFDISKKMFNLNDSLNQLYLEYCQSESKVVHKQIIFSLIIGKTDKEIELFSDPLRLMHVFRNLLDNAFFFTHQGFIRFGFEEKEAGIEFFVEDSGCGIEESSKVLIFKPFYKGKNVIVGNRGFGLGLAISKGLVKLLGSDLQFTSVVGKGSRFYFTINNKDIFWQNPTVNDSNNSMVKMKTIQIRPFDNDLVQN